jgi:protein involved in polysaccharide export with SLBB domain
MRIDCMMGVVAALMCGSRPARGEGAATAAGTPAFEGQVTAAEYVLGAGDRLRIELAGLQESASELEVNIEGRLHVPHVGVFTASGQTLAALRKLVETRLRVVYPQLRASVTLVRPRTFLVHVTGAVEKPGTYSATPLTRVSAVIPLAGGSLPSGSLRTIQIQRRGVAEKLTADLVRFNLLGDATANPTVLDSIRWRWR